MKSSTGTANRFGSGYKTIGGKIPNNILSEIQRYRKNIAGRYRAVTDQGIGKISDQEMYVSQKVDGEIWFMVKIKNKRVLVSASGNLIEDIPVLKEVSKLKIKDEIIVGELYVIKGKRERPEYISKKNADKAMFAVFDIISADPYSSKLSRLEELFRGRKLSHVVPTQKCHTVKEIKEIYDEYIAECKEGIIVRAGQAIYKIKPQIHIDATIIGYTLQAGEKDQVGSLMLGTYNQGKQYTYVTMCAGMTTAIRKSLFKQLKKHDSDFLFAHNGCIVQFTTPKIVAEFKCTEVISEIDEQPIPKMVIDFTNKARKIQEESGIKVTHPTFVRLRTDKTSRSTTIPNTKKQVTQPQELSKSEILHREIYTKDNKNMVKKIIAWKTNKEHTKQFAAYVVCLVDFSYKRQITTKYFTENVHTKQELEKTIKRFLEEHIKSGWKKYS